MSRNSIPCFKTNFVEPLSGPVSTIPYFQSLSFVSQVPKLLILPTYSTGSVELVGPKLLPFSVALILL